MKGQISKFLRIAISSQLVAFGSLSAQTGTWTAVANQSPNPNMGVMVLMTDGTVLCHNATGGNYGTGWDKLTPNASGSYVNGTWTTVKSMNNDRLFFPTQVLPNGQLFAAGGEYGAGATKGEVYDPVANTWTNTGTVTNNQNIYDGNSQLLSDGSVLVGVQNGQNPSFDNLYFTPGSNSWATAPICVSPYNHDEAEWVKLPDYSILFVGIASTKSCRFEQSSATWITDGTLPDSIFDPYGEESGAGFMLPNGKAVFFGATGHNAIYTPTGTTSPGTWTTAAFFPKIQGTNTGQTDAPAAMMVNGHILCAVSPVGTSNNNEFVSPVYFVEYNYATNTMTQVKSPIPTIGGDSIPGQTCYQMNMLDLPDGNVLVSIDQANNSNQYWIYTPGSAAIAQGKPTIGDIYQTTCGSYYITGKLFNGISEGAAYGDDWQMSSNYPIVRLTNGSNVYYAKTTNWNRLGAVQTDSLADTAQFTLPAALPYGTYSLVVVANGFASNPTVFTYTQFKVTTAITANVTCNGQTNGNATATVSGGKTPYTYKWSNASTTVSTSNPSGAVLSAGTYTITVTDNIGCTTTATVTITQPTAVSITIASHVNTTCSTLGSATANAATGGTSPYTYKWTPSGGTALAATGLAAGAYTITATDNHGCTGTATVTIATGSLIRDSVASISYPACNGDKGSATIGYKNGTAPYTFTWSPNTNTTASATGLSIGTYTVIVNDKNNCPASVTFTVTQPTLLTVSTSVTSNVTCHGGNNGSANATAAGGTTPYTYAWSGGGTSSSKTAATAGTYTITITDKNGCSATATAIITQPATAVAVTASTTANITCNGGNNGSVSSTATGGSTPYTYAWSGGGTSSTKTAITAGTYTITVHDKNGCSATATATVTQPALLSVTATTTSNISCHGANNGVVSATPTGGTAAYTYAWSGGGTNSTKSGLSNGTYTITVTDSHGCTATATTTVTQPNTLTVTANTTTNVLCNGNATGTITSTAGGGTNPYTYSWTGGGSNATETGRSAGTYTITLTDKNGCSATAATTVTQPTQLTVTASTTANELCNGENIGKVSSVASGGIAPYTYAWSGGGTNATKTALMAGTYTITVKDKNGCSATATTSVTQPVALTATANVVSNAGCLGNNGSLSSTVSGGTSPYTYLWTGGKTNSTLTGLTVGTYTLGVKDANGCSATSSATITQAPVLSVAPNVVSNVLCFGGNSGSALANPSGGTLPYTYTWTGGGSTDSTTGLTNGSYIITVTDNGGCSATGSVTITQPTQLVISAASTANVSCNGGSNGVASSTPSGGTAPYTYLWTGGATNSSASGLSAGTYTVSVSDNNGCSATSTATIIQPATLNASAAITAGISCNGESNGTAMASATGGTPPYTYAWSGGGSNAAKTGLSIGTYTVSITDINGCTGTATTTITQPSAMALVQGSKPTVSGECLGVAWVSVSGGTPAYSYKWTGGATTDTIKSLCVGSYCCRVTDKNGCIDSVCVNVVTGIQELSNASDIHIFPDPNNGNFTVTGVLYGQIIEVYNYLGQLVNSTIAGDATIHFNISDKANGVYLIRIENKDGSVVTQQKMIKTE